MSAELMPNAWRRSSSRPRFLLFGGHLPDATMQSSRMEARLSARCGSAMFGPVRTRSECVVHFIKPEQITAEMVEELRRLSPFDPEHLPGEILLTEAFQRRFADLPQVASFDTAFHHDLPRVARLLPIPRRYEAQGVRRYGFHGLSYAFLMRELARLSGPAGDLLLELSMYYRYEESGVWVDMVATVAYEVEDISE